MPPTTRTHKLDVKAIMPSVKPRTNLATVTMPVRLASAKEIGRVSTMDKDDTPYNVDVSDKIEVPQFSILLTRKNVDIRSGSKTIPVFAQLNKIKTHIPGSFKQKRQQLLRDLKFAGIAFTHAKRAEDVGDSNLFAAVIGGSHTVMTYNCDHNEDVPLRPGTTVRWTLPMVDDGKACTDTPVRYQGTGNDIFAELEPVDPSRCVEEVQAELDSMGGGVVDEALIQAVITAYESLRSREIGTVIGDNGRGSVDLRLK